jgi:uncharacterized protein YdaU (DUF1376 family)
VSAPWFPFYVGDYVRDTARLTTKAHGAYLLLMLDYWVNGAPPDDDAVLATITKLPVSTWRMKIKPLLAGFFQVGNGVWRHGRIEREIAHAIEVRKSTSAKAKAAADKRWADHRNRHDQACLGDAASMRGVVPRNAQPQPQSQLVGGGVEGGREAEATPKSKSLIGAHAFTIATDVLAAMGKDPHDPISVGAPLTVQGWLNAGWNGECILIGVKRGMTSRNGDPPSTLKYFEKAIARAHAELTAHVPVAVVKQQESFHVPTTQRTKLETLSDVARRHAKSGIAFGPKPTGIPAVLESGAALRLLPQG